MIGARPVHYRLAEPIARELAAIDRRRWELVANKSHAKLVIDGRLVGVVPVNPGGFDRRASLNVRAQIRRHLAQAEDRA